MAASVPLESLFHPSSRLGQELPLFPPSNTGDSIDHRNRAIALPRLVPKRPPASRDRFLKQLEEFDPANLGSASPSGITVTALRSGLLLWHDYLDESHEQAQSIEGEGKHRLGDYWHAILHRREPDYGNSKYWFRQVGRQPIFDELQMKASALLSACRAPEAARWHNRMPSNAGWDPFAFVDLCEACACDEESELALAARRIQLVEMALLLEFTRSQL